ncbi:hypothetical protein ACHQM5_024756 [Ranunculus cassubicifolius]
MGIVDGTLKCPQQFKKDANDKETTEIDPAYDDWQEKDQMILGWINASLTASVLSTVARFKTSHESWKSLEKWYASPTQNLIMHLRNELFNTRGEGLSITEFLDKINHIADNLALAGKPIDDDDIISIIMNNVGSAYETTVSSVQARDTPIAYDDLVALLLGAEMRFKAQNAALETTPTALYTPRFQQNSNRGRVHNRGAFSRGCGHGRNSSLGHSNVIGSGGVTTTNDTPVCQICDRPTHTAIDCYQRMNQAYEGRVPTKKLSAMAAVAQGRPSIPWNDTPTTWITDTGASNHITPDLANLAIHDEYRGKEQVAVGNGAGSRNREDAFPWKE